MKQVIWANLKLILMQCLDLQKVHAKGLIWCLSFPWKELDKKGASTAA